MENEIIINWVTYVKKEDNQKKQSKRGDKVWFHDISGNIYGEKVKQPDIYKPFCYPTKEELMKARDKQLALYRIKTYAEEKRGEFVPDWNNDQQIKYSIGYDNRDKEYYVSSSGYMQELCFVWLATWDDCKEIIEKFKDDLDILFDKKWNQ